MKTVHVLAVAGLLAVSGPAAGGNAAVVERADADAVVGMGAKYESAGDLLRFAIPMFDQANKARSAPTRASVSTGIQP